MDKKTLKFIVGVAAIALIVVIVYDWKVDKTDEQLNELIDFMESKFGVQFSSRYDGDPRSVRFNLKGAES